VKHFHVQVIPRIFCDRQCNFTAKNVITAPQKYWVREVKAGISQPAARCRNKIRVAIDHRPSITATGCHQVGFARLTRLICQHEQDIPHAGAPDPGGFAPGCNRVSCSKFKISTVRHFSEVGPGSKRSVASAKA
jgi:hypothetical protein